MRIFLYRGVMFLLLLWILACSSESGETSDGDKDDVACRNDADCPEGSTCFSGVCRVPCESDRDCPAVLPLCGSDGYCVEASSSDGDDTEHESDPDGDSSMDGDFDPDSDDEPDGDVDPDSEVDGDIEYEEDIDWPEFEHDRDFSMLSACEDPAVAPCLQDIPFRYIDDEGRFLLGATGADWIHGFDLWENWIVFYHDLDTNVDEPVDGTFVFDYLSRTMVKIVEEEYNSFNPGIGNGYIVVKKYAPYDSGEELPFVFLYKISLEDFQTVFSLETESFKDIPKLMGDDLYWHGTSVEEEPYGWRIWSLDADGQSISVDTQDYYHMTTGYSVGEDYLAIINNVYRITVTDRESLEERIISEKEISGEIRRVAVWGKDLYWSDLRLNPGSISCGLSIIHYDLDTDEETVLKAYDTDDGVDYAVSDVWEDWLVYEDYSEGAEENRCLYTNGNADIILRHVPSGDEWNLSPHEGYQLEAKIWGHLVVWLSKTDHQTIGGIDLCLHPEIKSRFPGCEEK